MTLLMDELALTSAIADEAIAISVLCLVEFSRSEVWFRIFLTSLQSILDSSLYIFD